MAPDERPPDQTTERSSKGAREFGRGSVGSQQDDVPAGRKKQAQKAQGAGAGGNLRGERAGARPSERPD